MLTGGYVRLPFPAGTLVDVRAPQPRRYHLDLAADLLRCGLPAAGAGGRVGALVARRGLVRLPLGAMQRTLPRRDSPQLDRLRDELAAAWGALARRSSRLPDRAPSLSLLGLRRSAGWLVFAFGRERHPLVVCKIPSGTDPRPDDEVAFLESAPLHDVIPQSLGRLGAARVQEGMPGRPMRLDPLTPEVADRAGWTPELDDAARVLAELGRVSGGAESPRLRVELDGAAENLLPGPVARRVETSLHRVHARTQVSVLCHGDLSPQNVLVQHGAVSGLVDWDRHRRGFPGADLLTLAVSVFEQRLGLTRWHDEEVARAFRGAWDEAPLLTTARRHAAAAVDELGVPADLSRDLEIAFFARRLQRRLQRPAAYAGGPVLAARMLERVCEP